jgi:cytochrome oxidase assembly protein ShyY1
MLPLQQFMHRTKSIGPWTFRPGLYSTLVTALLVPLFIFLGYWQLGRMELKKELQQNLYNQQQAFPLQISTLNHSTTQRFKSLEVSGHFINEQPILLDNQHYKGQIGYRVIMPFKVQNPTGNFYPLLLIDRGWVPMGPNRNELPHIQAIHGEIMLRGIINDPPKPFVLENPDSQKNNTFPLVVQTLDFNTLGIQLKQSVFPFLLQLQNQQSAYAYQILPISFGMMPTRHLGYAIQWFVMALALLLYYFFINIKRSTSQPIAGL